MLLHQIWIWVIVKPGGRLQLTVTLRLFLNSFCGERWVSVECTGALEACLIFQGVYACGLCKVEFT